MVLRQFDEVAPDREFPVVRAGASLVFWQGFAGIRRK
jgi:hypothetical protein